MQTNEENKQNQNEKRITQLELVYLANVVLYIDDIQSLFRFCFINKKCDETIKALYINVNAKITEGKSEGCQSHLLQQQVFMKELRLYEHIETLKLNSYNQQLIPFLFFNRNSSENNFDEKEIEKRNEIIENYEMKENNENEKHSSILINRNERKDSKDSKEMKKDKKKKLFKSKKESKELKQSKQKELNKRDYSMISSKCQLILYNEININTIHVAEQIVELRNVIVKERINLEHFVNLKKVSLILRNNIKISSIGLKKERKYQLFKFFFNNYNDEEFIDQIEDYNVERIILIFDKKKYILSNHAIINEIQRKQLEKYQQIQTNIILCSTFYHKLIPSDVIIYNRRHDELETKVVPIPDEIINQYYPTSITIGLIKKKENISEQIEIEQINNENNEEIQTIHQSNQQLENTNEEIQQNEIIHLKEINYDLSKYPSIESIWNDNYNIKITFNNQCNFYYGFYTQSLLNTQSLQFLRSLYLTGVDQPITIPESVRVLQLVQCKNKIISNFNQMKVISMIICATPFQYEEINESIVVLIISHVQIKQTFHNLKNLKELSIYDCSIFPDIDSFYPQQLMSLSCSQQYLPHETDIIKLRFASGRYLDIGKYNQLIELELLSLPKIKSLPSSLQSIVLRHIKVPLLDLSKWKSIISVYFDGCIIQSVILPKQTKTLILEKSQVSFKNLKNIELSSLLVHDSPIKLHHVNPHLKMLYYNNDHFVFDDFKTIFTDLVFPPIN